MQEFVITSEDREQLEAWLGDPDIAPRIQMRAQVVLALAGGLADREVARQCGVARQTVALWRRRVQQEGTVHTILTDAPGRGRKPSVPADVRAEICAAYERARRDGRTRSVRDLAKEFGLSAATVHRALKAGRARAELTPPETSSVLAPPWLGTSAEEVSPGDASASPA